MHPLLRRREHWAPGQAGHTLRREVDPCYAKVLSLAAHVRLSVPARGGPPLSRRRARRGRRVGSRSPSDRCSGDRMHCVLVSRVRVKSANVLTMSFVHRLRSRGSCRTGEGLIAGTPLGAGVVTSQIAAVLSLGSLFLLMLIAPIATILVSRLRQARRLEWKRQLGHNPRSPLQAPQDHHHHQHHHHYDIASLLTFLVQLLIIPCLA